MPEYIFQKYKPWGYGIFRIPFIFFNPGLFYCHKGKPDKALPDRDIPSDYPFGSEAKMYHYC
jgi:hypothetical protein